MNDEPVRAAVIEALLSSTSRVRPNAEDIAYETRIGNGGLGISSLALLHAFVAMEKRFGILFNDGAVAAARFDTVGDLQAFVEQSLAGEESRHDVRA